MSRRLEVELTSERDDGTWTWRAAGAKQPKGVLDGGLLYDGVSPGDVVKVEAEFDIDGIVVTSVVPPKKKRAEPERIELLGSGSNVPGVTTQLVGKRGGGRRDRDDDRGGRGGRGGRRGGDGGREGGRGGGRRERGGGRGERRDERPRDDEPERPKPKRLRPGKARRNAWIAELPEEQKPVAEQLVLGGIPAVRKAIDTENAKAEQDGRPKVNAEPLVAMAEQLLPKLRTAEWMDRAEAAQRDLAELDLRDLRSVVVAAEDAARSDEAKGLAQELRDGLTERVEAEHQTWLDELNGLLADGRIVRALRVSSRPPKAGAPFPKEMADRMVAQANEALGSEVSQQRWGAVLEAVAYSPVRTQVEPAHLPAQPGDELQETLRKIASRVPEIAGKLGVTPSRRRRGRRKSGGSGGDAGRSTPPPPPPPAAADAPAPAAPEAPTAEAGAAEAPVVESSAPEAPTAEASAAEAPVVESSAPEAPTAEASAPEAPVVESSAPEASAAEAPVVEASAPETPVAETSAPEAPAPEASAPEASAPTPGSDTDPAEAPTPAASDDD
ncbi:MAG: hypothetical protein AAGA17_14850 [Actinomycetota bacterium]